MYKRDNGIYYCDFIFNGKRYHKSLKTKNEKLAQKLEEKMKDELLQESLIPEWMKQANLMKDITLEELFDDAYNEKWQHNRHPLVPLGYTQRILEIVGEDCNLDSFDPQTVIKVLKASGNTNATINRYQSTVVTAINIGKEKGKVPSDYRLNWKRFPEPKTRLRFISKEAQEEAIEKADEDLKDIIPLLVDTGARLGELLSIEVMDFQSDRKTLTLNKTKNGLPRTIPLTDRAYGVLKKLSRGLEPNKRIFEGLNSNQMVKRMERLNEKLGDNSFTLHELRHTTASKLANSGCDSLTIQSFLGHKSVKTTERYVHISGERLREAVSYLQ